MTRGEPGAFQPVEGRCPACRHTTLFVASGGYITCSFADWLDNPTTTPQVVININSADPSQVDRLLDAARSAALAIRTAA